MSQPKTLRVSAFITVESHLQRCIVLLPTHPRGSQENLCRFRSGGWLGIHGTSWLTRFGAAVSGELFGSEQVGIHRHFGKGICPMHLLVLKAMPEIWLEKYRPIKFEALLG